MKNNLYVLRRENVVIDKNDDARNEHILGNLHEGIKA
jgi:hypothetical protein